MDARTDVFSFGVLLYQMLTGRHPFLRGSSLETLSAIREGDPEAPTKVAPGLPPEAERAILRCLHKEPSRRWQSMADLSAVLRDLREDSESARARGTGTPGTAKRSRAGWWAAGLGLVLVVAAAFLLYPRLTARTPPGPLALSRLTFDGGQTGAPSVSADGRIVAYSSDRAGEDGVDVWVQHVTEREPARLTHDPGDDDDAVRSLRTGRACCIARLASAPSSWCPRSAASRAGSWSGAASPASRPKARRSSS